MSSGTRTEAQARSTASPPKSEEVVEYLQAFYHGPEVKALSSPRSELVPWESATTIEPSPDSPGIGLKIGIEIIGIRTRPSKDGIFSGQLNLDDLLDAAITMLPKDAYALLMLVDHNLYEDEEDDFCCGRACGGSRVAVVSTARYNPALDVEKFAKCRDRACLASIALSEIHEALHGRVINPMPPKNPSKYLNVKEPRIGVAVSAMRSAVDALQDVLLPSLVQDLTDLWLGRICKTASHELGHCFGMDHCVFRACIMQGTAGLSEDARQPPYLCPVDPAKVLTATGADAVDRYAKLLGFCERFPRDRLFIAFGAWMKFRLKDLQG